eukprot:6993922-Alexandrium_andersonii.AAC.1
MTSASCTTAFGTAPEFALVAGLLRDSGEGDKSRTRPASCTRVSGARPESRSSLHAARLCLGAR